MKTFIILELTEDGAQSDLGETFYMKNQRDCFVHLEIIAGQY